VFFKIIGKILDVEIIASDKGIREKRRLRSFMEVGAGES